MKIVDNCAVDDCQKRLLVAALVDIIDLVEAYADVDDGQPNLAMRVLTVANLAFVREP